MSPVERALAALADAARDVPGIEAERRGETIVLRGRGLLRRWADDPRLHLLTADARRRMMR
jgi:hypothetical protein